MSWPLRDEFVKTQNWAHRPSLLLARVLSVNHYLIKRSLYL